VSSQNVAPLSTKLALLHK